MFLGTYYNSIDQKNRMIVPSKHRDSLGGRCVLTRGMDRCLYIYSMEAWQEQLDKAEKLPQSDPKVRAFIRHFFSNAVECEFDRQGRMVVPPALIAYAGIRRDLVTMGAMNKIEVWAREVWDSPDNPGRMAEEDFESALKEYNF